MELTKILFYGSIPMALVSLSFFIYTSVEISDLQETEHEVCKDFMKYNIIHLGILLTSILVLFSFICCGNCLSSILFVGNAIVLGGQLIEKYTKKDERCNPECRENCMDLVDLSDKINICLITNGSIIILIILYLIFKGVRFIICCK
jgi:hypothetical protein